MKSLIEELYYILEPAVTIKGKSSKIISRAENKLCKRLKGRDKQMFGDYEAAHSEFTALTAVESFKQGFKTGCRFMREVLE